MRVFGLLGFPLHHSRSKEYFTAKFEKENLSCRYENFQIESITDLQALVDEKMELEGLSVTIPYKSSVIRFLDRIDPVAKAIGAVNCLKIYRSQKKAIIHGFNTDAGAFRQSVEPMLHNFKSKALILGTGGSSKAVAFALSELNIPCLFVSRNPKLSSQIAYNEIDGEVLRDHKLIVNCTPSGMFPETDASPDLPYKHLTTEHILFDLVYNPEKTTFLKEGILRGANVKNGLEMLVLQAEASWKIWNSDEA